MLKSIFKKTTKFALISVIGVAGFLIILIFVIVFVFLLNNYGSQFYINDNDPIIYNATYLDKSYDTNGKQAIFLVKNGFFQKSTCQSLERWADKNLTGNNLNDSIYFVQYHHNLSEDYSRKSDYPFKVMDNLICKMKKDEKICYICNE